jgi:hypothetical protein
MEHTEISYVSAQKGCFGTLRIPERRRPSMRSKVTILQVVTLRVRGGAYTLPCIHVRMGP